ncbi:MAG TPA: PaaI family thioesterase [Candidatus Nosocomiicoccus stercorigallinarum]|nr:PaaI family thioesterase [Candidatus Nosocomiicoccus stercorigallinarum]
MTNLLETFNIEIVQLNKEKVVIEVDVTDDMKQPFGIIHGGMNAVLIETAISLGGTENVEDGYATGVEINVNHIRPVSTGRLITTATPIHIGKSTQIWTAEIKNNDGKTTAVGRMTLMNVKN